VDELLRFLELEGGRGTALPLWESVFAIGVALICGLGIGITYRTTHRTPGYSQSFVHTLILISLITSVIMIVIGSNIARAFSLVGAMSIIRFRNAVKETRDVGFLFLGIASGMSAGTRFYALALVSTAIICGILLLLERFDFARPSGNPEGLLRIQLPPDSKPESIFSELFEELFTNYSLATISTVKQGLAMEAVYSVQARQGLESSEILAKVSELNENMRVVYHVGAHRDSL